MACASVNCSRYQGSIMAVSSGRPHMFTLYHRGRGHEPVTVAGRIRSLVAVNAISMLFQTVGFCLISAWMLQDSTPSFAECELFIWLVTIRAFHHSLHWPYPCRTEPQMN